MHWYPRLASISAGVVVLMTPMCAHAIGTPAGTQIRVSAKAACPAGTPPLATASVVLTVAQIAGTALLAESPPTTIMSGQTYYVPITVRNRGNGTDTFGLNASSASGWAVSFVRDDNADGVHQDGEVTQITSTGAVRADTSRRCFVKVAVPPNATKGDTVTAVMASAFSPTTGSAVMLRFPVPIVHRVDFTSAPAVSPTAVASADTVQCSAAAVDSQEHAVTYAWSDGTAGGAFSPSASFQNPVYTAKANATGADKAVTLTCTAMCSQDGAIKAAQSTVLTVHSEPSPEVLSVSPADGAANVAPSASLVIAFSKPMDHSTTEGAIECTPALVSPAFAWSADSRTLIVRHAGLQPGRVYACTVSMFATDVSGMELLEESAWSFTSSVDSVPTVPGDLNRNGMVDSADLALFTQEWLRWHSDGARYDPATDTLFDLDPRTDGAWPSWSSLPDGAIDISDAAAFTECWLRSSNTALSYSLGVNAYVTSMQIYVSVSWAPFRMFAADVVLPDNKAIDPSTGPDGNLQCVYKLSGVAIPFFSEYDAARRTVRMTGALTSTNGQFVAVIQLR